MLLIILTLFITDPALQLELNGIYENTSGEYTALEFNEDKSGFYHIGSNKYRFNNYSLSRVGKLYHIEFTIEGIKLYGILKKVNSKRIGFFSYTDRTLRDQHSTSGEFTILTRKN